MKTHFEPIDALPRFEREVPIRFAHCDPAGMVFFPQYMVLFNGLVEDWFTHGLGIGYAELLGRRRIGLPTVSLACEFHAPSRMGEILTFALATRRVGTRSLRLALQARGAGQLRVAAEQVLVTTSLEDDQSIDIPDDLRCALRCFDAGEPLPLP